MNSQTGEIFLAEPLDYEEKKSYGVTYIATDGGGLSSSVSFQMIVLDFNDQGPIFIIDQYDSIVTESSTQLRPNISVYVSPKRLKLNYCNIL